MSTARLLHLPLSREARVTACVLLAVMFLLTEDAGALLVAGTGHLHMAGYRPRAGALSRLRRSLKRMYTLVTLVHVARHVVHSVPRLARRQVLLFRRSGLIADYLATHETRKLQIGAGPVDLPGWLCTDLFPRQPGHVFMDATRAFPFEDGTFDYVLAEHVIQEFDYAAGLEMARECARVLQPGGRIRISTPDLQRIATLYDAHEPAAKRYMQWRLDGFAWWADGYFPGFVLNDVVRCYRFIYDYETLRHALEQAGLADIVRIAPGQSTDPHLTAIDQHGRVLGDDDINTFESLVVEAVKPRI